jgi:isocitrate lyase
MRQAAVKRAKVFAPYADMLWLETKVPDVKQATGFAAQIHEAFPKKWLVYNLSPSFNWSAHGFSEETLKSFVWDLGKAGFVFQLVSLAGLHSTGTITRKQSICTSLFMLTRPTDELSTKFKTEGMLAYVNLVQKRERETGCDMLTHQKWSGASYIDRLLNSKHLSPVLALFSFGQSLPLGLRLLRPQAKTARSTASRPMLQYNAAHMAVIHCPKSPSFKRNS